MSGISPTEKRFEIHIEDHLKTVDYSSTHFSQYDRNLCLIRDQVISFIRSTQQKEWRRLQEVYDKDAENKVLTRISNEISKRGIIDVLRNQVVDRGVNLNLCYFKPKSDLNPDHFKLYQSNRFTVVRQLHYSNKNENSIDMVLFLNGLPIVTMELKNQLSGQNFKDSENQNRHDRDPKDPLLKFKRCMVHFCVDNNNISMTTRLAGKNTFFLPYKTKIVKTHLLKRDIELSIFGKKYSFLHLFLILLKTLFMWRKRKITSSTTRRRKLKKKKMNY